MPEIVITLVARVDDAAPLAATVERVAKEINGRRDWLAPGEACDIYTTAAEDRARRLVAGIVLGTPIDHAVQAAAGRRKRLLVADMDSTMIGQECIDELADYAGKRTEIAAITERAMRGDLPFEPALRERVRQLAGLPASVCDKVLAERIRPNPGAAILVRTMRKHAAHTALVSGGFTAFTGPVASAIGFDSHHANTLLLGADGRLTGNLAEPILGREAKRHTLLDLAERLGIDVSETLAIGDGANDISMVQAAALGIAYRAKPALAAVAVARIDHADLTAALYFQGYRRGEFASA
ncbi:MAG: phosphoserine phosphatase SerB [Bauldia sp.]